MDKNILEQYEDLKREYEDIKERIRKTEADLEKYDSRYQVQDSVSGGQGGIQHFTIKGFPYPEYSKKKTLLQKRKLQLETLNEKLKNTLDEVEKYIDSIEDSRKRTILRYRYMDGMTWRETAKKLGSGNNEDSVRIEIDRYIKKHPAG
jgi:DNA repair exonuclease SbcCD ATPase subunit